MRRDRRQMIRGILGAVGVAWLTMVTLVVVVANEVAIPLDFLLRPAAVVLLPALIIGLVCGLVGAVGRVAAVVAGVIVILPELWVLAVGLAGIEAIIWLAQRRVVTTRLGVGQLAVFTVLVLFAVSLLRLAPSVADYAAADSGPVDAPGPPVYLLLLDGYPRADELAKLGIDTSGFIGELEARGFDHYPDATSAHQWTHRTLQAMVAGSADGIPDEAGWNTEEQAVRAALRLPTGFVAIDPPASHVVMRGGRQLTAGGMNDFEVHLLGMSLGGALARDWAAALVADSLRGHFEGSLRLLASSDSSRTFAHVLAPHPPFLYAGGVAQCWPDCGIFDVTPSSLGMSLEEWADGMSEQLVAVNARVMTAVDDILERHPNAVIVLFSDHGGKFDGAAELHHTFLAARTPGRPGLFEAEPHPHALLRLTMEAYP
jgi:hypothetical protein